MTVRILRPMNTGGSVPPGGLLPDPASLTGATAAWHRALPYTRLTDYGMSPADARELLWSTAQGAEWATVSASIADRHSTHAAAAADAGRTATARESAQYAIAAYNVAQVIFNFDTDEKRELYNKFQEAVAWYASLPNVRLERISVPFDDSEVSGWLMLPSNAPADAAVVVWGGMSGWGASYLSTARALADRGIACLLAEGPGQGAARLRSSMFANEHTLGGYHALVTHMLDDPRYHGRVGIQGNSFGGLMAARITAMEPRMGACVVNGASPTPVVPEFRSAQEQILAFTGTRDIASANEVLEGLSFKTEHHNIHAPLLVLHGGADPLVTESQQSTFLASATHPGSELVSWPDGEHTLYNHAAERDSLTADWFRSHLVRAGEPQIISSRSS